MKRETGACVEASQQFVLKLNQPAAKACFFLCALFYLCVHPLSSVRRPSCTDLAFLRLRRTRCGPLWIFILLSQPAAPAFSPRLCVSVSLNAEFSLSAIDFCFLSSSSSSSSSFAPVLAESSQSFATDCVPLGLLGNSKFGLFKLEEGHWFKERLNKQKCGYIFGSNINSLE